MLKIIFIIVLSPLCLLAQVTPKEGDALNYRVVGFSFPEQKQTTGYKVEIAKGYFQREDSFAKNIFATIATKKNRAISEVTDFGSQYTWRVVYLSRSKTTNGEFHHFSTLSSPDINPDSARMRVVMTSEKYKDNYVFIDGNRVLYDMKGNPIWFFPQIEDVAPGQVHIRDLKITPFGTISAIINECIYEISYHGHIIWKGPKNKDIVSSANSFDNGYHHEFTRLDNGHYMVMSFEQSWWQLPTALDSSLYVLLPDKLKRDSNNISYQKMFFGSLIEYDQQGNVIWSWSGSDYFKNSDLAKRMTVNNLFDVNDTHANAFYFDEKTKNIYISFRDINRIIKIRYPDGKVLNTYGTIYSPANARNHHLVNGIFCGQHSCRLSGDGYLYLFNNNICRRGHAPTILMFQEPLSETDTLKKIWEFECPTDELSNQEKMTVAFNYGGNVLELPDKNLFVCMGGTYGKVFIVDKNKRILWCAQPEKWDKSENNWTKQGVFLKNNMREGVYRASIINRKELESLIWQEP